MNKMFLNWLSGFVDSRGCFYFDVKFDHEKLYFYPRFSLYLTDDVTLNMICNTTKLGTVYKLKGHDINTYTSKKLFRWDIFHRNQVQKFIYYLSPYIKIKNNHVDIFQRFFNVYYAFHRKSKDQIISSFLLVLSNAVLNENYKHACRLLDLFNKVDWSKYANGN